MKTWLLLALLFVSSLVSSFATAATITIVDVNEKLTINKDGNHELNLSRLLKSNAEIASVKIRAKSDFGGSQVYLEINGILTNGGVIDTDPALYETNSGFAELFLKNYERMDRQEAKLIFTPAHNTKIQTVEVVLGEAEELIALKTYDNPLVTVNDVPPPSQTRPNRAPPPPPVVTQPIPPKPVVVIPNQPSRPVQPVNMNCVPQRSGKLICVGDKVRNRLGENGVVTAVHHSSPSQVTVNFQGRGLMTRDADYVLFFSR